MTITVLQNDIVWDDPQANHRKSEELIESNPGADLYILPEMFSTGFCTSPEGIAEHQGQPSLDWLKARAAKSDAAIAASVAVEENGKYYNRFYFVKPDSSVVTYDKHHLFTYGGEHERFTAGEDRVVVEWRGVRILLEICYDLRFPAWSRNRGDYDMIIYVASWPTPRMEAWKSLLVARAIENQCYVAGVNRTGEDPSCSYCGGTAVIDPYGHAVASCPDNKESVATADIDMKLLEEFRQKFPVLNDADDFVFSNQ